MNLEATVFMLCVISMALAQEQETKPKADLIFSTATFTPEPPARRHFTRSSA